MRASRPGLDYYRDVVPPMLTNGSLSQTLVDRALARLLTLAPHLPRLHAISKGVGRPAQEDRGERRPGARSADNTPRVGHGRTRRWMESRASGRIDPAWPVPRRWRRVLSQETRSSRPGRNQRTLSMAGRRGDLTDNLPGPADPAAWTGTRSMAGWATNVARRTCLERVLSACHALQRWRVHGAATAGMDRTGSMAWPGR